MADNLHETTDPRTMQLDRRWGENAENKLKTSFPHLSDHARNRLVLWMSTMGVSLATVVTILGLAEL